MIDKIYKCQMCGDECGGNPNADLEAELYWGVEKASEKLDQGMMVVCDSCWKDIQPKKNLMAYLRSIMKPLE